LQNHIEGLVLVAPYIPSITEAGIVVYEVPWWKIQMFNAREDRAKVIIKEGPVDLSDVI